ncbi:MAG TPA: hypothetical protein VMS21_08805, partial [Methylomirabilota bacterium]|nr:hypothetical protein [Methylomirabilota bacterium]
QSAVEFEDGWVRGSTINLGTGTGAWSGQFTNPDSSLILVLKEGTPGSHFLVWARDKQGEWHEVGRGSRSLMGNREFRQVSWRLPADGGPFEIEVIPQDLIVAEYWIRPLEGG